jgi:hypothetical protein
MYFINFYKLLGVRNTTIKTGIYNMVVDRGAGNIWFRPKGRTFLFLIVKTTPFAVATRTFI